MKKSLDLRNLSDEAFEIAIRTDSQVYYIGDKYLVDDMKFDKIEDVNDYFIALKED